MISVVPNMEPLVFGKNGHTPPKINMEPENGGLEDDFPFQTGDFHVPCLFSGVYPS